MAKNKEELRQAINELPLFEMRNAGVAIDAGEDTTEFKQVKRWRSICKVDSDEDPVVYARPGYHLLQFKDMFLPFIDGIDAEMEGYLSDFGGMARLLVFPEMEELQESDSRYGLIAINSVDCTTGIIVKFCIEHGDNRFTVPSNIAGLKKKHTKNAGTVVKDYIGMVNEVKLIWRKIITEFPQYNLVRVDDNEEKTILLSDLLKKLNLGIRMDKYLNERYDTATKYGGNFTLWDLFIAAIGKIDEKNHKSEIHKDKHIEKMCKTIFDYAFVLSL